MEKRKVIVIGLDGATWDLIQPWTHQGKLKAFEKLTKKGCYGQLESTIPHISPIAWTSMTTGKNPAKHGIFGFTNTIKNGDDWKIYLYTARDKQSKEVWDYIKGTSFVINIPLTYPPRKINGIMITGMYTPSMKVNFAYPKEIIKIIHNQFPDYKTEIDWQKYTHNKQQFLTELYKVTDERTRLFWYLFKKEWDFIFFIFSEPDRLQHLLWDEEELLRYYQHLDLFLDELLEKAEENNIQMLIVSDHGFGKIKKVVNVNAFLEKEGYLKAKKKGQIAFLWKLGLNQKNLKEILTKYKLQWIYNKIPAKMLRVLADTTPGNTNPIYNCDLPRTKAIMVGPGCIYINETQQDNKSHLCQEIQHNLEELIDPDSGEGVIDKVYEKKDIYQGKLIDGAPDLLVLPKKGYSLSPRFPSKIFEEPASKKADHALHGVIFAYGPGIRKCKKITAHIYDLAPTILHMFNISIPQDLDGRVIQEIFEEKNEECKKAIYSSGKKTEKEKLKEKIWELTKKKI